MEDLSERTKCGLNCTVLDRDSHVCSVQSRDLRTTELQTRLGHSSSVIIVDPEGSFPHQIGTSTYSRSKGGERRRGEIGIAIMLLREIGNYVYTPPRVKGISSAGLIGEQTTELTFRRRVEPPGLDVST